MTIVGYEFRVEYDEPALPEGRDYIMFTVSPTENLEDVTSFVLDAVDDGLNPKLTVVKHS